MGIGFFLFACLGHYLFGGGACARWAARPHNAPRVDPPPPHSAAHCGTKHCPRKKEKALGIIGPESAIPCPQTPESACACARVP